MHFVAVVRALLFSTCVRFALVWIVLAGCVPVSRWAYPDRFQTAASTLRREGSAVVSVEETDDHPARHSPTKAKLELIRLDEPIRVRLTAPDEERTMTVADLYTDCPPDLTNSDANRRTYPRCVLFRADKIRTGGGRRVDKGKLVLAGLLVAAAGDVACMAACPGYAAAGAIVVGSAAGTVGLVGLFLHELFDGVDLKH